ncbi:MAG: hypothetical protein JW902_03615 [Syntrophaceae bacterium]|nr:hypothetical protein [Syntrophaceae bacterium]
MNVKVTENETQRLSWLGANLLSLYSYTDEETWPPWLRITFEIAFIVFLGASMLMFLSIG